MISLLIFLPGITEKNTKKLTQSIINESNNCIKNNLTVINYNYIQIENNADNKLIELTCKNKYDTIFKEYYIIRKQKGE